MPDLIIGFDTEYRTQRPDDHIWEPGPNNNMELVRTACIMDPDTGKNITLAHYPTGRTRRHRTGLVPFVGGCILEAINAGLIERRPDRKYSIELAAHFARADIPSFRDWMNIKKRFDSVRNTFCTMQRPAVFTARVPGLGSCRISVTLIDTILHAPATHRSLAKLGDALGFQKIELPPGMIERMDELHRDDPELFERYAIRDAELTATLVREMTGFYRDTLGLSVTRFPPTLSSAGVRMFKDTLKTAGISIDDFLGQDGKDKPWPETINCNHLGAEAFHGGRNEAFWVGATPSGVPLIDIDLAGAYSTILAAFRMPDWKKLKHTKGIKELTRLDAGMAFATVRFEFPKHTRFPSLPVRNSEGLFYPLRGDTTITGAELIVAKEQGAQIEILNGVFVPWTGQDRPILEFSNRVQEIRQEFTNGSLQERAAKEVGNSLYGKFAQAVAGMRLGGRPSTNFDSRTGRYTAVPPSSITQPCIAAWITGICRAVVSEMLARLPSNAIVCSVTTDGLLSSVPLEEMDLKGPLCRYFAALRELAAPGTSAFEVKHVVARAFMLRTRGALTIEAVGSREAQPPMMARAGNRLDEESTRKIAERDLDPIATAWAENDALLKLAATRRHGQKSAQRRKITLRDQWLWDADLITTGEPVDVSVSMDFDLKRKIIDPHEGWRGCFSAQTRPWDTLEDAEAARATYRQWRKRKKRVLRTLDDLNSLNDEISAITGQPAQVLPRGDPFGAAVRVAAANGLYGFPAPANGRDCRGAAGGYNALADKLTACGIKTSRHQLNRARDKPMPDGVEIGSAHAHVYRHLQITFPRVEWNAFAGIRFTLEIEPKLQTMTIVCNSRCGRKSE